MSSLRNHTSGRYHRLWMGGLWDKLSAKMPDLPGLPERLHTMHWYSDCFIECGANSSPEWRTARNRFTLARQQPESLQARSFPQSLANRQGPDAAPDQVQSYTFPCTYAVYTDLHVMHVHWRSTGCTAPCNYRRPSTESYVAGSRPEPALHGCFQFF